MPGALLFDLDGTLIDSDPLHMPVFVEMFAARGIAIDAAFYERHIHGRLNQDTFGEFFPEEDADRLSDEKEAIFRERLGDHAPPMPGLPALLALARREGLRTAVVTNAPRLNAAAMLGAIGLPEGFDTVVLAEDCPRGKPFPDPYLAALARLGVAAAEAVAFEDSPSGIRAAVAAGIFTVGIRSTLDDAGLRAAGASATLRDFEDPGLSAILERLKGPVP